MNLLDFCKDKKFLMLALDHRASFKKLMNPENPESVSDADAVSLKAEIINSIRDQISGLLIDVEVGLKAYSDRTKPFLLPVEKTGYTEQKGERITELEYGVSRLQELGAAGAKLLLYFNPYVTSAERQLATARQVVEECKSKDFPFFLEIRTYEPDHEVTVEEMGKLTIETLKIFKSRNILPDVFKIEYPGSALACQTVTAILEDLPWILLTRGVSFDEFVPQFKEATERSCQGFLAGRALWQEAGTLLGEEKRKFLDETLPERFKILSEIAASKI